MNFRNNGETAASIKIAMPEVVNKFTTLVQYAPEALLSQKRPHISKPERSDIYGSFAMATYDLFMEQAEAYVEKQKRNMTVEERQRLIDKFKTARLGIGVIAMFSEVCVLKLLQEAPSVELEPAQASRVITNSYGFIQNLFDSGPALSMTIARHFLRIRGNVFESEIIDGAMEGGEIVRPDRLEMFRFELAPEGEGTVEPVDLDQTVQGWIDVRGEPPRRQTTCPAEIYTIPNTDTSYTKLIFDSMAQHQQEHILPSYIPLARAALQASTLSSE